MQKAIRWEHSGWALRAAPTLLRIAPERLWRRCGGIAFEDIGIADLETVSLTTAALAGKRWRMGVGGEWIVARHIVTWMTKASKCRAADDLLLCADLHPAYAAFRRELTACTLQDLLRIASGSGDIIERAVALRRAFGAPRPHQPYPTIRRAEAHAAFDFLCETGIAHSVVEIAREAYRKTGDVLCPLFCLLPLLSQEPPTSIQDDEPTPETLCGGIPSWAVDLYSREGRHAFKRFLHGDSRSARWVRSHIPDAGQVEFLGTIVFRVEGQVSKRRWHWPLADELRRKVDVECNGPHCPDATEILELVRADLPLLNEERRHVL